MGSFPTAPNPQAPAPQGAGAPASASPQANPLQALLAKIAMSLRQLGTQNTIIQPELQEASQKIIEALQKVSQASMGAPAQAPAPPQQM
jgi:hypothetical protein